MQVWENLSLEEILQTLEMELAKAKSEMLCAETDLRKIKGRMAFIITAIHNLKQRQDMKI
jgi:hypothetical protein